MPWKSKGTKLRITISTFVTIFFLLIAKLDLYRFKDICSKAYFTPKKTRNPINFAAELPFLWEADTARSWGNQINLNISYFHFYQAIHPQNMFHKKYDKNFFSRLLFSCQVQTIQDVNKGGLLMIFFFQWKLNVSYYLSKTIL